MEWDSGIDLCVDRGRDGVGYSKVAGRACSGDFNRQFGGDHSRAAVVDGSGSRLVLVC